MTAPALAQTPPPAAAPATTPAVGGWRSERPAGADFELALTLHIQADGTAELYTSVGGSPSFDEKGTWRLQAGQITVLVFEVGRPPSPNEMLLEQRGEVLVPVRWNPEFYGKSPLGNFLRLPEDEPAR